MSDNPYDDGMRETVLGRWQTISPGEEVRVSTARSDHGYHFSVERSYNGGDDGDAAWSKAYPTRDLALKSGRDVVSAIFDEQDGLHAKAPAQTVERAYPTQAERDAARLRSTAFPDGKASAASSDAYRPQLTERALRPRV